MSDEIEKYVKRTYRYFYDDGLVEIAVGLLMLIVGAILFSWQYLTGSFIKSVILAVVLPATVIGGSYLVRRVVQKAKENVTYSRTGYVSYRQNERSSNRWIFLLAAVLLFIIVFFLPDTFSRLHFAVGYFTAFFLGYMGYRLGSWRFYGLGIAALIIGTIITMAISDEVIGTGLTIAGIGVILLLTGGVVFLTYLRQHPEPENESA